MKQCLFLSLMICAFLFAEDAQQDSSVTRIPVSAVKFYNIVDEQQNEIPFPGTGPGYKDPASERPFALHQPADRWFSRDKWMHLSASYFIVLQSNYVLNKNFRFTDTEADNISYGISLSLSLGKEFFDVFGKKGIFSWKDLLYDLIGSGLGYMTARALQ